MGESRSELLAWLNELLALSYTKVEQCGSGEYEALAEAGTTSQWSFDDAYSSTGYAYAQIMDSIYGECQDH